MTRLRSPELRGRVWSGRVTRAVDDRRIWLLIGTILLVVPLLVAGLAWYLSSTTTSGGEPSEGMISLGPLVLFRVGA